MAIRGFSRSKLPILASLFLRAPTSRPIRDIPLPVNSTITGFQPDSSRPICEFRLYHDGRPRGPLWRSRKAIGKEALFVIQGLKRFKEDEEKLQKFIKSHVSRLLKLDMIAVLGELERQEEVALAVKIFRLILKQDWYKPDVFMYKDLIVALSKNKKMDDAMDLWETMRKENLFPDTQTYTEVIRGFLRYGSPSDAMNIYEDMKKSPDPPDELPFRILLKGLLPHPLLRNRVKQDFEDLFPDQHVYDPPKRYSAYVEVCSFPFSSYCLKEHESFQRTDTTMVCRQTLHWFPHAKTKCEKIGDMKMQGDGGHYQWRSSEPSTLDSKDKGRRW